jgi:trans-aconitate methyltransferase
MAAAFDANDLIHKADLQKGEFNKAFSNAAMHWILRPEAKREQFFRGVHSALAPGGTFAFEMGGLGNVNEVLTALLSNLNRRIGLEKAMEVSPWFFPDEEWARTIMEEKVGGWKIEQIERQWRPTPVDAGGIEGWVRLFAPKFIEALPKEERESFVKEVVDVLDIVCKQPNGGYMIGYVRLRVLARKL